MSLESILVEVHKRILSRSKNKSKTETKEPNPECSKSIGGTCPGGFLAPLCTVLKQIGECISSCSGSRSYTVAVSRSNFCM